MTTGTEAQLPPAREHLSSSSVERDLYKVERKKAAACPSMLCVMVSGNRVMGQHPEGNTLCLNWNKPPTLSPTHAFTLYFLDVVECGRTEDMFAGQQIWALPSVSVSAGDNAASAGPPRVKWDAVPRVRRPCAPGLGSGCSGVSPWGCHLS